MNIKYILFGIIILIVSLVVFYVIFNPIKYTIIESNISGRDEDIDKIVNNYKSKDFEKPVSGDKSVTNYKALSEDRQKLNNLDKGGDLSDPQKVNKDKCSQIQDTNECDGLENSPCGYCQPKDEIMYGGCDVGFTWNINEKKCIRNGAKPPYKDSDKRNSRPIGNLCEKTEQFPNPWVPPKDPQVVKICKKRKEQELCKKVTTCGDDSVTNICGWCPVKNISMVKQKGGKGDYHKIKYEDDTCDWDYSFYGLDGPLVTGNTCSEFGKKFPCVGTQKKDGTHTKECLNFLYKKNAQENFVSSVVVEPMYTAPGCDLTVEDNYKDDTRRYQTILKDMNKNVKMTAKKGNDYRKAVKAHNNCYFGAEPDPCNDRFDNIITGLPLECTKKLFNQSNCHTNSLLNPNKKNNLQNLRMDWKEKINQLKSNFPVLSKITDKGGGDIRLTKQEKSQYTNLLTYFNNLNSSKNLNEKIFKSEFCQLADLDVGKKPCWYDFSLAMSSIQGVIVNYTSIDFVNSPYEFKNTIKLSNNSKSNKVYSKNYAVFDPNYILKQTTYEKKYFPYWLMMSEYETYWKKNWELFKNTLIKHPDVTINNSDELVFNRGSDFDILVEKLNPQKELKVTRNMYKTDPNFPYSSFIRIFKRY